MIGKSLAALAAVVTLLGLAPSLPAQEAKPLPQHEAIALFRYVPFLFLSLDVCGSKAYPNGWIWVRGCRRSLQGIGAEGAAPRRRQCVCNGCRCGLFVVINHER